MAISVDNPLKWLLAQLPDYLTIEEHAELMQRFEQQKKRYALAMKINDAKRRIRHMQNWPTIQRHGDDLKRWQEKLAKLEEQAKDL